MIYFIRNRLVGIEYFVPTEQDIIDNPHLTCRLGGEPEAIARLQQLNAEWLEHESYRFSISKEVVNGVNTTWTAADLVNDPEDGTYHVFNHNTGAYETVNSLTSAKQRMDELKAQFAAETVVNNVDTTYSLPIATTPTPIPTVKL